MSAVRESVDEPFLAHGNSTGRNNRRVPSNAQTAASTIRQNIQEDARSRLRQRTAVSNVILSLAVAVYVFVTIGLHWREKCDQPLSFWLTVHVLRLVSTSGIQLMQHIHRAR
jgi:hypothetical protein